MPQKPKMPPKITIENSTQNPFMPIEVPSIFGPITLPSSCWRTNTKITNHRHIFGSTSSISSAEGIAPINGPKNGMMFVTPTMTEISSAYGIFSITQPM